MLRRQTEVVFVAKQNRRSHQKVDRERTAAGLEKRKQDNSNLT